jgi:hypothetical protein
VPGYLGSHEKQGIPRSRLFFAGRVTPADYLARYQVADLFLDTLPFNAGATASDALWAGLPLLTCAGKTFSSRMAGSLLQAVDLPELIAYSLQEYEDKAVYLAQHPERIAAMKHQLASNRMSCALFDSPRFVRDLEDALESVAFKGPPAQEVAVSAPPTPITAKSAEPLVSVLMPCKSAPEDLENRLNSVLAQTYANLEIIIGDSGDDSMCQERITPYLERHPNIKYFRLQGLNEIDVFDKCFALSGGEYINFLMQGDKFHPEKIHRMMHYYVNYPRVGLVTSFCQPVNVNGHTTPPMYGTEKMFPIDTAVTGKSLGELILRNESNLLGGPSTVLLRRSDIGVAFGTFCGHRYHSLSDVATWLDVLSDRDCIYISDPLSQVRVPSEPDVVAVQSQLIALMEWYQLAVAAHQHQLFLTDRTEFLDVLANKLRALSNFIATHHVEIQIHHTLHEDISKVLHDGFQELLKS